jgi:SAM-dependent methyltransferase
MSPNKSAPNFEAVARPYRWIEYATFGAALQRCRTHFLPRLREPRPERRPKRRALVLGDGDGRFTAALVLANPSIEVDAVDISGAMLRLLLRRCVSAGERVRTHQMSALSFMPQSRYDLIASHFFLDCLTQAEVEALVKRFTPHLAAGGLWVVSEFRVPEGWMERPARALVAALYCAFRLLTGLRTDRLPDHAAAFTSVGFQCVAHRDSLGGLLRTELWQASPGPSPQDSPCPQRSQDSLIATG